MRSSINTLGDEETCRNAYFKVNVWELLNSKQFKIQKKGYINEYFIFPEYKKIFMETYIWN